MSAGPATGGHPTRVVTFDVETRPATCRVDASPRPCPACRRVDAGTPGSDDEVAALTLGCALTWDDRRYVYTSAVEFWDWLDAVCVAAGGEVWLINHNIAFDLMVLDWDASLSARGWKPVKVILPEPSGPFCVTWKRDGLTLVMANLANWWGMRPLSAIGAVIGVGKGSVDATAPRYRHAVPGSPAWDSLLEYCEQDCAVVAEAMRVWITFCVEHDLGRFAITQAGQALTAFRHRFMDHEIRLHTSEPVLKLERDSYYGGRTEAFFIGSLKGRYHVVDVNSLYPYVMRGNRYPVSLRMRVDPCNAIDPDELLAWCDTLCVVARVRCRVISESQRVVPVVRDGRLIYPIGEFDAVLTTPELVSAIGNGVVVGVGECAVYSSEPIFTRYVEHFYSLRNEYRESGNGVWVDIVKVFLNSLYGKFGQYNFDWEQYDNGTMASGVVTIIDTDTGDRSTIRTLGGVSHRKGQTRVEAWDSFCAIAAHVTAHARSYIGFLRSVAGFEHVYYCDTDSLFVDDTGLENLGSYVDATRLGALKIECTADDLNIRGLKDYTIGDKTRLKGVRRGAVSLGDGVYRQVQFRGIAGAMRAGEPGVARVGSVTKTMTRVYTKGHVGEDGWVTPIVLS